MQPDIGPVCQSHLEFMKWADDAMLAALSQASPDQVNQDRGSSFKSLFDTLNHVYLAELVWLRRVQGQRDAKIADLASPADVTALSQAWPEVHQAWIDWSRSVSAEDLQKPLIFLNMKGAIPYWQVVLHLVNHGSYHRGQVATMLRQAGIKPPGTDLISYYRTL
jgi:uncharacterized damage-inducible protein DinB